MAKRVLTLDKARKVADGILWDYQRGRIGYKEALRRLLVLEEGIKRDTPIGSQKTALTYVQRTRKAVLQLRRRRVGGR